MDAHAGRYAARAALPREIFRDLGAAAVLDRITVTLSLPLFVKPARGGSALGATPPGCPPPRHGRRRTRAVTAHRALGLRDLSPTDLIVCGGEAFFLEANVAPGLTETSTLPMALKAAGRSLGTVYRDLLSPAAARGT